MLAVTVPLWGWFALGVLMGASLTLIWVGVALPDPYDRLPSDHRPEYLPVPDDAWGSPLDGMADDEINVLGEWSDETATGI